MLSTYFSFSRKFYKSILKSHSSIVNDSLSLHSTVISYQKVNEPKEYRILSIDNIPPSWTSNDIQSRMDRLGKTLDCHIVINSIGESIGKAFITFENIKSVELGIDKINWKIPYEDPVKAVFYRGIKYPLNGYFNKKVLIVKNIPEDLIVKDLEEYINSYSKCIHISYPRTWDDKFLKRAYIYFYNERDAEKVYNKLHMRYVFNKKLTVMYATNYYDISDFRYLIENKVKLDLNTNQYLNKVHRQFLFENTCKINTKVKEYMSLVKNEIEKIEYYNVRCGYDMKKDIEMLEEEKLKNKKILLVEKDSELDNRLKLEYAEF